MRQLFRWQIGVAAPSNQSKEHLWEDLPPDQRMSIQATADRLYQQYHLNYLYCHSNVENFRENLYYLSLLETAFDYIEAHLKENLNAGDIGVSSWFYVQALVAFLKWYHAPTSRQFYLTGYERDAYRVYTDMHSRYDHALSHLQGLENVKYQPKAFIPQTQYFDILFMFFPFIFVEDHLNWGLPKKHFDPAGLLNAAWQSLKKEGILMVVNQGEEEQHAQIQLFEQAGIPIRSTLRFDSPLFQYDLERYVLFAIR